MKTRTSAKTSAKFAWVLSRYQRALALRGPWYKTRRIKLLMPAKFKAKELLDKQHKFWLSDAEAVFLQVVMGTAFPATPHAVCKVWNEKEHRWIAV